MSQLINLGQVPNQNIFKGNFMPLPTLISGSAVFSHDEVKKVGSKSLKVVCSNLNTTDVIFNFGDYYKFVTPEQRSYFFSICFNSEPVIEMKMRVYLNNTMTNEYDFQTDGNFPNGFFQRFGQIMPNVILDEFNFDIVIKSNASYGSGTRTLWFDLPCLTAEIEGNYNVNYKRNYFNTAWNSKTDLIGTQNLTANTDNLVQLTTTTIGNGYHTLLDSNGKITPVNANDVLNIDFKCTVETPSGSNSYLDLKLIVNGTVYRSTTHVLLKGNGNDDIVSVSWCVPVDQAFKSNGGEIRLNPNSNCTIKEKSIIVTRVHEAI